MKGTTVLKGVLLLLGAIFILHQGVSVFYKPIKTETAVFATVTDGSNITGIVLRNETPITLQNSGVLHFVVSDGNHVAKNGVIANVYETQAASITLSRINELDKKITELESLTHYNDLEAADLDMIGAKVNEAVGKLILSGSTGDYVNQSLYAEALLLALNKRQAALGNTASFAEQLVALKNERATLATALPAAKGHITAAESGYFVSKVDGYETVLRCHEPEKITPEFLRAAKPDQPAEGTVGKIVSDYEWFIAAQISINESLNYKEGDELTLYTAVKSYPKLSVKVKKINASENNEQAVVLFSCDEMSGELAAMRSGPMTVVRKEYSGLRVAKSALRVVDSVKGVYVRSGMQVKFVPVNILYSNDSYMICEQQTTTERALRLYDEVVVKGKKLYDGKVIG